MMTIKRALLGLSTILFFGSVFSTSASWFRPSVESENDRIDSEDACRVADLARREEARIAVLQPQLYPERFVVDNFVADLLEAQAHLFEGIDADQLPEADEGLIDAHLDKSAECINAVAAIPGLDVDFVRVINKLYLVRITKAGVEFSSNLRDDLQKFTTYGARAFFTTLPLSQLSTDQEKLLALVLRSLVKIVREFKAAHLDINLNVPLSSALRDEFMGRCRALFSEFCSEHLQMLEFLRVQISGKKLGVIFDILATTILSTLHVNFGFFSKFDADIIINSCIKPVANIWYKHEINSDHLCE